jgi:hypothetical protein
MPLEAQERIGENRMMHQRPAGEAMSREGKGTAAVSEAGTSRPIDGFDFTTRAPFGCRWLDTDLTARYLRAIAPDRAQAVASATEVPLSVTKRGALLFARKPNSTSGRPRANGRLHSRVRHTLGGPT